MLGQSLASTFGMRAWGQYAKERVVHSTVTEEGHCVATTIWSCEHRSKTSFEPNTIVI